ncbi:MAG TPA: cytochrome c oxidase subunit 3 [Flavobacteriales bacterium]|nr:cytochrome c oxidase subunit 3 [Flavobacteriales bacterium]
MSDHHHHAAPAVDLNGPAWGGKISPFKVSYGKLMMWFFLVSDALTFGGLLTAYGFARHAYGGAWPSSETVFHHFPFAGHAHLPLIYVAFMTFVLIVSSVTMVLAVEAGHRMDKKGVIFWLGLTVLGGLIFVGSQAWEWTTFIAGPDGDFWNFGPNGDNATLWYNSYGAPQSAHEHHGDIAHSPQHYAMFFFFITGFHGFHVFSGVVINIIILIQVIQGVFEKRGHYEMVEKIGLYWHFVDLVWVFVFTFFYLL